MNKSIFELGLHETSKINLDSATHQQVLIIRVSGGWIYQFRSGDVFVPLSDELKPNPDKGNYNIQ